MWHSSVKALNKCLDRKHNCGFKPQREHQKLRLQEYIAHFKQVVQEPIINATVVSDAMCDSKGHPTTSQIELCSVARNKSSSFARSDSRHLGPRTSLSSETWIVFIASPQGSPPHTSGARSLASAPAQHQDRARQRCRGKSLHMLAIPSGSLGLGC